MSCLINRFANTLHAILALVCLFLAGHLKDPHLLPVRDYELPVLLLIALTGLMLSLCAGYIKGWKLSPLIIVWLVVISMASYGEYQSQSQKRDTLAASGEDATRLAKLGQHLVVGYGSSHDIIELVRRGYVTGVFLTSRNARGKSLEQLRSEISALQMLRREAGLPPLIIASDQEGGSVSRLSPPLSRQPALASMLKPGIASDRLEQDAYDYGVKQAIDLADLGININFSPVIDLKPGQQIDVLDFHTRIAERAIADDPDTVARIALAYSRGLLSQAVLPTVKHFPGLGSVTEDTHHFSARLELPLSVLKQRDWYPFRVILSQLPALLMVGHVIVNDVDAEFPASLSDKLINNLVRENWNYNGVIISDDMTMAAVYNRGLCESSVRSLNAGVDLLLLAYDWEKVYTAIDCLLKADKSGRLNDLKQSRARLDQLPWRSQYLSNTNKK